MTSSTSAEQQAADALTRQRIEAAREAARAAELARAQAEAARQNQGTR
ncbi:hypothetical protein [Streptomyces sp. Z26]|nr:hypothetical protein [Streptomyces sp. Z26]